MQNPVKRAATSIGLPDTTSCTLVNKVCASGLKAIMLGASSILTGFTRLALAGGMESMSNCPHYDTSGRRGRKFGHRELLDGLIVDGLACSRGGGKMGDYAELCAAHLGISRWEQDEYANESYRRADVADYQGALGAVRGPAGTVARRAVVQCAVAPCAVARGAV